MNEKEIEQLLEILTKCDVAFERVGKILLVGTGSHALTITITKESLADALGWFIDYFKCEKIRLMRLNVEVTTKRVHCRETLNTLDTELKHKISEAE